jgi:hypothetical protein
MSEEDVRDGLRDAVAHEPPMGFDPDTVVAIGRRQVRRRALVAAGLATVAVAVAAVAVPAVLGRDGGGTTQVAEPPSSRPVTTSVVAWPPPGVKPANLTPDELRDAGERMTGHLREKLPAVLPSASYFRYGEFGGEASGQFYEGQTSINAAISFATDGGQGSVMITVWAPGAGEPGPSELCAADDASCEVIDDKGRIVAKTEDLGDPTLTTVYHYRETGDMVSVTGYNYDVASTVPPTYLPAVSVTLDQLTAIATDPELRL